MPDDVLEIGVIIGAVGIKGEVRMLSLYDEPERFIDLKMLEIGQEDGPVSVYEVNGVRVHKEHAIALLRGVEDRSAAESLKGFRIFVSTGSLTENEKAVIKAERLHGMEVFTIDGLRLGVLEEVIRTGANDVYDVRDGKKSYLLPAIADVIKSVDYENCRMVVAPLPGLFE